MNDEPRIVSKAIALLVRALKEERPAVLFLGQDVAGSGSADPILGKLMERLGRASEPSQSWRALIESKPLTSDDMQWLAERLERNVQSETVQSTLDVSWSAVFTTSIDPRLARRLETRGRQPESILAKDHFARVPRSRSRPPVYHLFGRCDETDPNTRCPRGKAEWLQRMSTHTSDMLGRVGETTTALGVLVVEGYAPGSDWLPLDSLLAPLSVVTGLQILWFGAPLKPDSEFYSELIAKDVIVPDSRRLSEVVLNLRATGLLETIGSAAPEEAGIVSLDGGKLLQISPSLRLRVEASAAIVDDTWIGFAPPQEGFAALDAFRRFHGDLGSVRNRVEGIIRGFAIKRHFESQLRQRVDAALREQGNLDRVVVLHGQSGTGKSIALARLAIELREDARVPVLIASGRIPQATDLDDFCAEAERAGASGTVIICDSNQAPHWYRDLANALRSRGRRIAVVGTSYKLEIAKGKGPSNLVEASAIVFTKERQALRSIAAQHGVDPNWFDRIAPTGSNQATIALFYRALPPSRERITSGISSETRATEEALRHRARRVPMSDFRTKLAEQLISAGLHSGTISIFDDDAEGARFGTDAAGRLIDYVMSAGRLECPVPVNLLIRTLNSRQAALDAAQIGVLFEELDLFRWRLADPEGHDFLISPRIQLEAELICRRRLADRSRELDCLVDLIESVRSNGVDRSSELEFLLDMLQKLGRDGPRGSAYSHGYLRIAQALTVLRTRHQVRDASLMLQESAFRRAALWSHDGPAGAADDNELTEEERHRILNEAREVIEIAISDIADGTLRAGRRTRENLRVERASIYGFLAVGRARSHGSADEIWSDYLAARTAIAKATAIADSYFPFDVGLWTPVDILDEGILSPERRAEMVADIHAVLDQIDTDQLPPSQQARFQERRTKVARVLRDSAMGEDAYHRLEELNPPVAYFLRARSICPDIFGDALGPFLADVRAKAREASVFLKSHIGEIRADLRCLHLLLQFEWVAVTGERLLRGERRPISRDPAIVNDLRSIVIDLNRAAGDGARFVFRFLEATLEWIQGDETQATSLWRSLARDTEYEDASRVIRRLFVADLNGKPVLFRGRVDKQRSEGHWQISVEGFGSAVDLLERDFRFEDLRPGREIRNFAIAFNYLGPIADPASRYGGRP